MASRFYLFLFLFKKDKEEELVFLLSGAEILYDDYINKHRKIYFRVAQATELQQLKRLRISLNKEAYL